jgi:TolA-binding protein
MMLALGYSEQQINYDKSIEYYKRFYEKDYADLPWAADAIMRLAVLEYNKTRNPRVAIQHCQYIVSKYPNHPDAERAMYFLAINAAHLGDKTLAESSCREFLRKYPQSGWAQDVQAVLDNEVSKLQDKRKGREQ